jgi:biotin carboxylase
MDVLFLSPHFPPEMCHFTRGLCEVGARVIGVGEGDVPAAVARHLAAWIRVPSWMDEEGAARAILAAVGGRRVDRVETLWEPTVLLAARVRERLGAPGLDRESAVAFRDKQIMKEKLAAAGLRVPRSRRVRTLEEANEAARAIGYPLVVKPIAGAGSSDTHRCDDQAAFGEVIARLGHVPEASVEEYVEGDELTYDAIAVDGRAVFESVTQYFPKPLIARNEQWVSPAQITFADPHTPETMPGIELGRAVLSALGMRTGFCHMEWYRKPGGEAVFGEIAARSGGGHLVDMMNWANDVDVYREWARSVCWRSFEAQPARRYHVAMVFKRAEGEGRIRRIENLDAIRAACGSAWVGDHLAPIGTPRRHWRQSVVGDGGVALRHADYDECRRLMDLVVRELRLYAAP